MKYVRSLSFVALAAVLCLAGLYLFQLMKRREPAGLVLPASGSTEYGDAEAFETVVKLGFDHAEDRSDWEEHVYSGKTDYEIRPDEGHEFVLSAASRGTSSAIFKRAEADFSKRPHLAWEWRVSEFPSAKKNDILGRRTDNDFAARVYVVFKGLTLLTSQMVQYVWDDHFPEGAFNNSGFAKNVKVLVVQRGNGGDPSEWVSERRDIAADYKMLFGKEPVLPLYAVGFMSDSDNTKTQSAAEIRNIRLLVPRDPRL